MLLKSWIRLITDLCLVIFVTQCLLLIYQQQVSCEQSLLRTPSSQYLIDQIGLMDNNPMLFCFDELDYGIISSTEQFWIMT